MTYFMFISSGDKYSSSNLKYRNNQNKMRLKKLKLNSGYSLEKKIIIKNLGL